MTVGTSRFKYPLRALEVLYAHRLEQACLLLAASQQRLDEHLDHIDQLRAALARCHVEWAGAPGRVGQFDPARHLAVREALTQRQADVNAALAVGQRLRTEVERCREGVAQAHRRAETVQRHKEDAMRECELESVRMDQLQADTAWPFKGKQT
ncbi:hypothetical protein [Achromobacter piechaudii]|uniref:hypothetical protein n=1 Tax=Achromobacter piechaudii TaxID=72556 RepID=UPI003DA8EBEA